MHILSTNNVEVFRHLGSSRFRALGVTHHAVQTGKELLQAVRAENPTMVLIDAVLADGNAYEICQALKADPTTKDVHVILLMSRILTRQQLNQIAQSGCDDVLALPVHTDDFYQHLAQIGNLPLRSTYRVQCTLQVSMGKDVKQIKGNVVNASPHGLGVEIEGPLPVGTRVIIDFSTPETSTPPIQADVVWASNNPNRSTQLGVRIAGEIPISIRILLEKVSQFDVVLGESQTPGAATVRIQGALTEVTDFHDVSERIKSFSTIDFDMAGVRYISSAGVKEWSLFLSGLNNKNYWFRRCSVAFVSQAAMVPSVLGIGKVRSFETPYYCHRCAKDEVRLLEAEVILHEDNQYLPPELHCSTCQGMLEFDDIPNRYFAFLEELQ